MNFFKKILKNFFLSQKKTSDGRKIVKNQLVLALISVLIGGLTGYGLVRLAWPVKEIQDTEISFFQRMFGKDLSISGKTASGDFLFSSFETSGELKTWKPAGVSLSLNSQYPAHGEKTLQVVFDPAEKLHTLLLTDLMRSRTGGADWSAYRSLALAILLPSNNKMALTLKITDLWGRQFVKTLDVAGGKGQILNVMTADIKKLVDLKKIDSVLLHFKPHGNDDRIFLDNVRLLAQGDQADFGGDSSGFADAQENFEEKQGAYDYGFQARRQAWSYSGPGVNGEVIRIPFVVKNETESFCRLCPVEGGIPLPLGEVRSLKSLHLRDGAGKVWPFQTKILAYWPDQSIKWVGLSFEVSLPPGEGTGFFLDYDKDTREEVFESKLTLEESDDFFIVNTGSLWVKLDRKHFYLFDEARIDDNRNGVFEDDEKLTEKAIVWLKFKGEEYAGQSAPNDYQLTIEEKGSQRIVVRSEGWLVSKEGKRFCKVILRYFFYAGKSHVKIVHSLIYTGYPANLYNEAYQNKNLPENEMIEGFGLRVPLHRAQTEDAVLSAGRQKTSPLSLGLDKNNAIYQATWKESMVVSAGEEKLLQMPMSGWIDYSDSGYGVGIKVRKARENFPKAVGFDAGSRSLNVDLWPEKAGPLDLQTQMEAKGIGALARGSAFGLGKTHEMLFYFHFGDAEESAERLDAFEERLIIRTNPYWIDATGAVGRLFPVEAAYQRPEKMLEDLFDWADRQIKAFEWYGMLNFGDTLTWWRKTDAGGVYKHGYGWHSQGRWGWYNVEGAGLHTGALLQFLRSGQWKYFQFGENLARHVMDIDTVHYNTVAEDARLKNLISDSFSQVGSMHRHNANHWGGRNEEASHTNIQGLMLYYYITGDSRVLEVAKESGLFFLEEPFTYAGHPDQAPLRAIVNAFWGDLLLYEATGLEVYHGAAEKLFRILQRGQLEDGSFLDTYNPEDKGWHGKRSELFMTWYVVPALIKYHELTQSSVAQGMFLSLMDYFVEQRRAMPEILNGFAYAYLLTHNQKYIAAAELGLGALMRNQIKNRDPMVNGLIYEKVIYHRPNIFLANVPYVFGALNESLLASRQTIHHDE